MWGFHAPGDGGAGTWHRSEMLGVRGRPIVLDQGAGMPDGEYRVLLTGGGGTGASARVRVYAGQLSVYVPSWSAGPQDEIADAIILEPGSGYTSPPALSTDPADWFDFHSNGTPATFTGSETFPVASFELADGRMASRTANGREYLLAHNGRVSAHQLGVRGDITSVDDAKHLQEAVRSMLTGRSQIASVYGGGPAAGGVIELPAAPIPLGGETIWVNSMGSPTGTEVVGLGLHGAARGSPRTTRPDGAHSGTVLPYGRIVIGDPNTDGVFTSVSRGISMQDFALIGGMEWWGVQHAYKFEDVLIVPDAPIGTVKNGVRSDGYGLEMHFCSTGREMGVFVTGGDQSYFGSDNELDAVLLDNCDQVRAMSVAASFCRRGVIVQGGSTATKLDITTEANRMEDLVVEACLAFRAEIVTLGRTAQDSTLPRVRIGKTGDISTKCTDVEIHGGSFSGNPKMVEHAIYSHPTAGTVTFHHDYVHRYPAGTQVIVRNDTAGHRIATVASATFDATENLTTVDLGSGVVSTDTALILVGGLPDITLASTSGTDTVLVAEDVTPTLKAARWVIVRNATDGDFAATVVSSTYDSGSDRTTLVLSVASVNAHCTALKPSYTGNGVAIDAQYVDGLDIYGNSITNFGTALKMGPNAQNVSYKRGRWTNTPTIQQTQQEIVKDPAATWASPTGDLYVDGVLSGKVESFLPSTVQGPTVTIQNGTITVSGSYHRLATEGGASIDDLDTILWDGGTPYAGQKLRLSTSIDSQDVRVTANGNISGPQLTMTLVERAGFVDVVYDASLNKWVVHSASPGTISQTLTKATNVVNVVGFDSAGARQQVDGSIRLRGAVLLNANFAQNATIATLPSELVPSAQRIVPAVSSAGPVGLSVATDGSISLFTSGLASGTKIYLDGGLFRV